MENNLKNVKKTLANKKYIHITLIEESQLVDSKIESNNVEIVAQLAFVEPKSTISQQLDSTDSVLFFLFKKQKKKWTTIQEKVQCQRTISRAATNSVT
jgi:hypothetical protein